MHYSAILSRSRACPFAKCSTFSGPKLNCSTYALKRQPKQPIEAHSNNPSHCRPANTDLQWRKEERDIEPLVQNGAVALSQWPANADVQCTKEQRDIVPAARDGTKALSHDKTSDWLPCQVEDTAYVAQLRLAGDKACILQGMHLHHSIIRNGFHQVVFLSNLLVQMYGKCGALQEALAVFAGMVQRNVFSWTLIIEAFVHHGQCGEALVLFDDMELAGTSADEVIFVILISACAEEAALLEGKQLHARIVSRGLDSDGTIGNALVNFYGKCCCLEDSWRIFNQVFIKDVVSWNTMIGICFNFHRVEEAVQLYHQMNIESVLQDKYTIACILDACTYHWDIPEGKQLHSVLVGTAMESDVVVRTALIKMYSNQGNLVESLRTFDAMFNRDLVSWNTMIEAFVQHAEGHHVCALFQRMFSEAVMPDKVTFLAFVSLCRDVKAVNIGKRIHACFADTEIATDLAVGNSLVSMYGKCGWVDSAQKVFENMQERDAVSWNNLISAYAHEGQGQAAVQVFHQMQLEGVMPNKGTFTSLLDAYVCQPDKFAGNLLYACFLAYGLELDVTVGNAFVNMHGKCGNLEEAQKCLMICLRKMDLHGM